jgi:FKBP-type peptidyl-prolyl cis-trans isomerase FkpA
VALDDRPSKMDIESRLMKQYLWVLAVVAGIGCGGSGDSTPSGPYQGPQPAFKETDLAVGEGPEAKKGATITVHYTGWLYDPSKPDSKGEKFDSSFDRDEPLSFRLGVGEVIPGWDVGFANMRVKGKRRLVIPAPLAYGAEGTPGGPIPPNAPLVFEMELLDVR